METITAQTVILGLGSNIGDSRAILRAAIDAIEQSIAFPLTVSSLYRSAAVLPPNAPSEWDKPYLNMAVAGPCTCDPVELLKRCKHIEQLLGRQDRGVWAPREIDVDILAYGTQVMQSATLTIPHQHLRNRAFALLPFDEVAPGWRHPVEGWTAYERLGSLPERAIKRLPKL